MKIKFFIDKKTTVWIREHHEIEYESKELLEQKLKELCKYNASADDINDILDSFVEQEILFDTIQDMDIKDNFQRPTVCISLDEENFDIKNADV
jgi:hypothetical protein